MVVSPGFAPSLAVRARRAKRRGVHGSRPGARTFPAQQIKEDEMSNLSDLKDLFEHTLGDVLYAERRIERALPRMKEQARSEDLARAFDEHHRETEGQIQRLETVFDEVGLQPRAVKCEAILGILEEAEEMTAETDPGDVRDAAILAAAQAVEHYEITRYGTLATWARRLGHEKAARLLEETLEQEKAADRKLSDIATSGINRAAA
jgi:ferritin-like metal-binding protein YciE